LYLSYLKLGYSQILFFGHPIFRFTKNICRPREGVQLDKKKKLSIFSLTGSVEPDGKCGKGISWGWQQAGQDTQIFWVVPW
jgi:hypothetical protein